MMQNVLKVALLQTALIWEDPVASRNMFSDKLSKISGNTDMIILPEMFTTGFTMNPDRINSEEGVNTLNWMKETARDKNMAMMGSIAFKERNKFTNRLFLYIPMEAAKAMIRNIPLHLPVKMKYTRRVQRDWSFLIKDSGFALLSVMTSDFLCGQDIREIMMCWFLWPIGRNPELKPGTLY
jgi:hypothetical protein